MKNSPIITKGSILCKYNMLCALFVALLCLIVVPVRAQISTAADDTNVQTYSMPTSDPRAVIWAKNNTRAFIAGNSSIYEYSVSSTISASESFSSGDANFVLNIKTMGTTTEDRYDVDDITGLAFNDDGTYLYFVGEGGVDDDYINILYLPTAYDLSTARRSSIERRNIVGFTEPQDIQFNGDGTKAYVLAENTRKIYEFELSTPFLFDSSTPSPGGSANELLLSETNPTGFAFNANGSRLFVAGFGSDEIAEFYLPDPYEVSTAEGVTGFSISGTQVEAIAINRYDKTLLVLDNVTNSLSQYGFNGYPTTSSVITDGNNNPDKSDVRFRVTFSENVTGFGTRNMTIVKTGTVTYGNVSISPYSLTSSSATTYYVDFSNVTGVGSLKIDIKEATSGGVKDYTGLKLSGGFTDGTPQAIGSAFNVLSASNSSTFDVNETVSGASSNRDVKVNDDGTKLFVLDASEDKVLEFTMATPYDVSTATYDGDAEALSLTGIENTATGMSFESDGSKLFVLGESVDGISEFSLTTPYDVSTASFVKSTAVSPANTANDGFDFSSDGMKVFIAREGSIDVIAEYDLAAPYDITSITASGVEYEINQYETAVRDLEIVLDGRFMIVVGTTGEVIHTVEMTTLNDLSTAVYREEFARSTTDKEDNMYGIGFSDLGDWMYVIGTDEIVYSYSLNRAPSILSFDASEDYNPSADAATIDIEFREPVIGLTLDDFELTLFGNATGNLASLSGSEELYSLTINGLSGDGAIKVVIKDETDITDKFGSPFTGESMVFMVGTAYNLFAAIDGEETGDFDVDDQDTSPRDIEFNNDGSKMFINGDASNFVYEYNLSALFDVNTASLAVGESLESTEISSVTNLEFSADGYKLFLRNGGNSSILEYTLTAPYDISTAQYQGAGESLDVSGNNAFTFNDTGSMLYSVSGSSIKQYSLSTPFDVSSGVYQEGEDLDGSFYYVSDIVFDRTGQRLFIVNYLRPYAVITYWLSTPYDISTGVRDDDLEYETPDQTYAIAFDNYGSRFYTLTSNDFVYQYNLNLEPEVVSFEEVSSETADYAMELHFSEPVSGVDNSDFEFTNSDGVSVSVWSVYAQQTLATISVNALGDGVLQADLKESETAIVDFGGTELAEGATGPTVVVGSAFDVSEATYLGLENSYTFTEETSTESFTFNNDGSKMYVTGTSSDDLHEYNLSVAYDLTTVTFGQTFDLDIGNPTEITFNAEGTKLFVLNTYREISEFSLSTPFDISSASYAGVDDSYVVYSQDTSPKGIAFNADGTIMYMLGDSGNDINTYSLSTPYDINKATALGSEYSFSINSEESSPRDLQFSPDGKRLLVVGNSGLDISQYTLSSAWDVTTATYLGDEELLDLSADLTSPGSIAFSADGTKLFVLSEDTGIVHSYDLNSAPAAASFTLASEYPKNYAEAHYVLTFDEPITGLTADDLEIISTGTASAEIYDITSAGGVENVNYYIRLVSISGVGSVALNLKDTDTDIIDLAGKELETSLMSEVHDVDRVPPTATITIDDAALKIGDTPTLTITFSEEVEGFENTDLILPNGTVSALATTDNLTFTATYTPDSDIEEAENIITIDMSELTDLAGNAGETDASTDNFEIDTKRPTGSFSVMNINEIDSYGMYALYFSENVLGINTANMITQNFEFVSIQAYAQSIDMELSIPAESEELINTLSFDMTTITDEAGNAGEGILVSSNFTVDMKAPTHTIEIADDQLSIGESTTATFTFSEPVKSYGLTLANFFAPNATVSDLSFVEESTVLTVVITPVADAQDYENELYTDGYFADLQNNDYFNSSSVKSANYIVDNIRPGVTVDLDDVSIITGETAEVTFTFTEAVNGFDNADITLENGTLSDVGTADEGLTFTAIFTPTVGVEDATNVISVDNTGYSDAVGNAGEGSSVSPNFEINTVVPTLTISIDDANLILDETATITFIFSEAVTGFDNDDITVSNGNLSAVSSLDGGITFTATFTPTELIEALENVISVDNTGFEDLTGNAGFGTSESENFIIDGVIPTSNVSMSDDGLIADESSLVTFTFSEYVEGFDNDDISAPFGTLTEVISEDEGLTYTATFTPTADVEPEGDFFVTVENAGVADLRGNAGAGTSSGPSYDIETLRPTLSVTLSDDLLTVGETMEVTFTFSESVYGFDNEDITVTDGTLTDVATEDDVVFTAVFTPTNDLEADEIVITTRDGAVKDDSGNLIIGVVSSPDFEIDTKNPSLIISIDDLKLLEAETATITFEFSEVVMGFTEEDVIVENGQIGMISALDNTTFTAVFTPDEEVAEIDNVISVEGASFTDLAGNAGGESSDSESFEINTVIPVITFEALEAVTYGDDSFDLIASSSSGLTVTFESSNPEVATIEGTSVTIMSAGNTTITASQAGNDDVNAAIVVEQPLIVNQALITVTADDQTKIYGESNPELSFVYSGLVLEEDESVIDGAPSITTLADEISPVGEYELTVAGGVDDNYAFEYVTGTLTITKAALMATADDQSKTYGADNPELTIAYSGFVNGDDASDITEPAISTSATVASGVGTYPITLSDGSAANYIIESTDAILTVSVADLVVSADNQTRAYGEENPTLTINYDGFVLGETEADLDVVPAISTEANMSSDVGEYAITVSGAQDANYSITFEQGTLSIQKADQVIDFATVSEIDLLNENTIELTASASSEMEVVFSLISGDGSIVGSVFTANASGTFVVEASQDGDGNYNAASVAQTFNVNDSRKDSQTIAFGELEDKIYGDLPFTLSATASSALGVIYSATGPVSLEGDEVTIIGTGEVTITATQNGDDTFNPAPSVSQSFAVAKAILTATAGDQTSTFGEAIPDLTISYAGFVGSDNSSDLDVLPTSATTATVGSDAGDYEVTVSGGNDDNYEMTYVSGLLTIEKANQTIEFATVEEIDLLNENTIALSATASTGLDVAFALIQGDGSLVGNMLTANSSGTFIVEASQAGNENYNAVSISQSFNVNDSRKDEQSITFADLADKTYGDEPFSISAVASSELEVTFSAEGPVSVTGNEITILGAGEVIITAAQAGDDTYNPAPSVAQAFVVEKASLTATADDKTTTYGVEIPELTIDYAGFVGADAIADIDELPTAATTATMGSDAGTYEITVSGGNDDNYQFEFIAGQLTIEKSDQSITFSAIEGIDIATQTTVNLIATASSDLAVEFSLTSGDGSIDGDVLTVNSTGTFFIEASQAGNTNYNAASAVQTFNVNDSGKTDQTISFGELADKVYGDAPFDISATATSSLAVHFTATGPVSILDNEVTITGAGEVTITASQTGDDTFNPASSLSQSFNIEKAILTATVGDQASTFGEAIPDLTISYAGFVGSDNSGDLDVLPTASTNAVEGSDVGNYEIIVSGGSDDNYEFTYVSGSLAIAKADQTITFEAIDDIDIANVSSITLSATTTSDLGITYTLVQGDGSITGNELTVNSTGTYIVEASQAGNNNYNAALNVGQIFNVTDSQKTAQSITFESLEDKTYGEVFTLGAQASSGLSVSYSVASGPATLSGAEVSITGVGDITIVATQAGDETFNPAASVSQTLAVAKASLTAAADDQTITYGDDIPELTITYQGFVSGDSASDLDEQPLSSTVATSASDAGEYAITLAGGASANYEITLADGSLTVNKASAAITISDLEFDADGTGKVPTITTDPADLNFTVTYDGASTAPSAAGSYEVVVTIDETNYMGSASATLVLNEVLATLQALNIRTYPNPTVEYFKVEAALDLQFEVYSMSGILELVSETNKQTDVSSLAEGVYLIRVLDAKGKVVKTQQLIKQ
ncbi:MAG: Ig-like domain-containing protein [Cyclobacteriaceae bacterium]